MIRHCDFIVFCALNSGNIVTSSALQLGISIFPKNPSLNIGKLLSSSTIINERVIGNLNQKKKIHRENKNPSQGLTKDDKDREVTEGQQRLPG